MKITTSTFIPAGQLQVWPLLTQSRMEVPGCFCLGVPRPVACELPNPAGGIGSQRRCISDRGTVTQEITHWQPPSHLRFHMVATDHSWGTKVESLEENFLLMPCDQGTKITRTTRLIAKGPWRCLKELGFYFGLKRVHFYVFRNWRAAMKR